MVGGKSGAAVEGAAPGEPGLPLHPITDTCGLGPISNAGVRDCYADIWDCCEASSLPGCPDPTCEAAVCALDLFCCIVVWDWDCAHVFADWLCPQCSGEEVP